MKRSLWKGVKKKMAKRIDVKGTIIPSNYQRVYDWIGWEATSPVKIQSLLDEAGGEDVDVYISSGGGDVYSGAEIFSALREYSGKVVVKIISRAASAAGIIAMAGDVVQISPVAQFMLHNVRSVSEGDYRDHYHSGDVSKGWNETLANAYQLKTGLSKDELLALMDKETWLSPQRAVELKFADEIMFDEHNQLTLVASDTNDGILPSETVQKLHNILISQEKGDGSMSMVNQNGQQQNTSQNQQHQAATEPQNPVQAAPQAQQQAVDFAAQERARLQAIDAIAANIDPALVNEAKYGPNPMTAEQLAFKAMQEGKMIQTGIFQAAVQANAAAGAQGVGAASVQQNSEPEFDLTNLADVNKVFNALDAANEQRWAQRQMNLMNGGRI